MRFCALKARKGGEERGMREEISQQPYIKTWMLSYFITLVMAQHPLEFSVFFPQF